MVWADTGFVASLFLKESTSSEARQLAAGTLEPIAMTRWSHLELRNALNRAVFTRRISAAERDALWRDVESDFARGTLLIQEVDDSAVLAKARALTDLHTPTAGTRTLDLLHVAAALLLDAAEFWSFDERQRKVATAEGLAVRP